MMSTRRDLAILIGGLAVGMVLAQVSKIVGPRGPSADITELLERQPDPKIALKDLIQGTFFCIGPPKAMLVTTISLVLGKFTTSNEADFDDANIWTIAAVDPGTKTLSIYWVNSNRVELERIESIVCGQNLEIRTIGSESMSVKRVTVANVEIRQLGGYSRVEGAGE